MLKKALISVGTALAARAGTITATWLVATLGVDGNLAGQIGVGLSAGILVGIDLLTSRYLRDAA